MQPDSSARFISPLPSLSQVLPNQLEFACYWQGDLVLQDVKTAHDGLIFETRRINQHNDVSFIYNYAK